MPEIQLSYINKLEYLAVYGRASIGDYYGCAFCVLAVFRQHMVKSLTPVSYTHLTLPTILRV